jgi:hypothetical protein
VLRLERFVVSSACLLLVLGCAPKGSESKSQGEPGKDGSDPGPAEIQTQTDPGTGSGSGSGSGSGTGEGSGTDSNTETGTETITNGLVISGVVSFSSTADEVPADGFLHDALVDDATVFLRGFPDQSFKTDDVGAFTIHLDLDQASLTGPAFYDVVVWKTINGNKYGRMVRINDVEPNKAFDAGEIKLTYTKMMKWDDNGTTQVVDKSKCVATLSGFEGKANVVYANSELVVDYLPKGSYSFALECDGYEPFYDSFGVTFDEDHNPAWGPINVELSPLTP